MQRQWASEEKPNLCATQASHIVTFRATDIEPIGATATRTLEIHNHHWGEPNCISAEQATTEEKTPAEAGAQGRVIAG